MTLQDFSLDFRSAIDKSSSFADQTQHIDWTELAPATIALYDRLDELAATVSDVTFIAADPAEDGAPGWNLAHVIVHLTAGLEENAVQASTLARGAEITGRPRYETDWETVVSHDQITQRLAESRRMVSGFLQAWPDQPHLDNIHDHGYFGTMNAVAYQMLGIATCPRPPLPDRGDHPPDALTLDYIDRCLRERLVDPENDRVALQLKFCHPDSCLNCCTGRFDRPVLNARRLGLRPQRFSDRRQQECFDVTRVARYLGDVDHQAVRFEGRPVRHDLREDEVIGDQHKLTFGVAQVRSPATQRSPRSRPARR